MVSKSLRNPVLGFLTVFFCVALPVMAQEQAWVDVEDGQFLVRVTTSAGIATVHRSESAILSVQYRTVPDSDDVAVTWFEERLEGRIPFYALSLDGVTFHPATPTEYDILLRFGRFDPLTESLPMPAFLSAPGGSELQIVQYWTQGLESYRDALRGLGAEVHGHLWHHANIVRMDAQAAARARALPFVRAIVDFHVAYKLDEQLLRELTTGVVEQAVKRVNIVGLRRGDASQGPIAAKVAAIGGRVNLTSPRSYQMHATLDLGQILEIARMDDVQFIDLWTDPSTEVDMDLARIFHGATVVDVAGFRGQGVRGEVADVGTNVAHPEFLASPVIPHGGLINGSHGTSTYGQIFASGVNAQALGMLSLGQGIAATWGNYATGNRYDDTAQLVDPAGPYRALFQSNSGGHPLTTQYTSDSMEMDLYLFDFAHFSIIHSQSNQNSQNSRAGAWGKNTVAVGGVAHGNTLSRADDADATASIGPAADGRVKPELASFYDNIYTTSQTAYTTSFGGTSGATPIVAGCFGLFYEMWHTGVFGNPTGATPFDSAPMNTTARAFMIAGATQWDFVNGSAANTTVHRDIQGWGNPDVGTLWDQRAKIFYVDETDVLAPLASTIHGVTVMPGEAQLKISLVWRDNPGTISSSMHLINDLDLRVTSPSGTVYRGNFGLTNNVSGSVGENVWSLPGGTKDSRNSVENVFVQNPEAGTWQIEVLAANINQDNHVETPALDCDYALCAIGVSGSNAPFFFVDTNVDPMGNITLAVQDVPMGTDNGFCLFSEVASGPQGQGPLIGLYPSSFTFNQLFYPAQSGDLLHWTWPVSGVFPDTSVTIPGGTIPSVLFPIDVVGVAIGNDTVLDVTSVRRINN